MRAIFYLSGRGDGNLQVPQVGASAQGVAGFKTPLSYPTKGAGGGADGRTALGVIIHGPRERNANSSHDVTAT